MSRSFMIMYLVLDHQKFCIIDSEVNLKHCHIIIEIGKKLLQEVPYTLHTVYYNEMTILT